MKSSSGYDLMLAPAGRLYISDGEEISRGDLTRWLQQGKDYLLILPRFRLGSHDLGGK